VGVLSLADLAPQGRLRVGINLSNRALVREDGETLAGMAPDIARRLAGAIGARLDFVRFASARNMAAAVGEAWDIAFLADDPSRQGAIAFSRPYLVIEATLAVRTGVAALHWRDLNRSGSVLLGAKGAAYERHLRSGFDQAEIRLADSPTDATSRFLAGEADALAGVRESLDVALEGFSTARVLPEPFGRVSQTIGLPAARAYLVPAINRFLDADASPSAP
jgi:polar amino acid transport system substrate-binding protein